MARREPAFLEAFGIEVGAHNINRLEGGSKFEALSADASSLDAAQYPLRHRGRIACPSDTAGMGCYRDRHWFEVTAAPVGDHDGRMRPGWNLLRAAHVSDKTAGAGR